MSQLQEPPTAWMPERPERSRRGRNITVAVLLGLLFLTGSVVGFVLLFAPVASAAGGCGG